MGYACLYSQKNPKVITIETSFDLWVWETSPSINQKKKAKSNVQSDIIITPAHHHITLLPQRLDHIWRRDMNVHMYECCQQEKSFDYYSPLCLIHCQWILLSRQCRQKRSDESTHLGHHKLLYIVQPFGQEILNSFSRVGSINQIIHPLLTCAILHVTCDAFHGQNIGKV